MLVNLRPRQCTRWPQPGAGCGGRKGPRFGIPRTEMTRRPCAPYGRRVRVAVGEGSGVYPVPTCARGHAVHFVPEATQVPWWGRGGGGSPHHLPSRTQVRDSLTRTPLEPAATPRTTNR